MTPLTILWFLDLHCLVTAEALAMIRTEKTRLVKLRLIERFPVTALTKRRQNADRSMMVAPLAHRVLTAMEVRRYSTFFDMLHQPVDDLPMGKLNRFILLGEQSDRHRIRYVGRIERKS
jgi:hypothetical protein